MLCSTGLTVAKGLHPAVQRLYLLGTALLKESEDSNLPEVAYNLSGMLYLSTSGWILLTVPNALARGVFAAMQEPGIELPPSDHGQHFNAHITVFTADEVRIIGGGDKITERGKHFKYTLGRLYALEPGGWPEMAKVWVIRVHSPELQELRRSYGLSSLPHGGDYDFHISVAVKRKGVLGRNDKSKGEEAK